MKNLIITVSFLMGSVQVLAGNFICSDTINQKIEFTLECKSKRKCSVEMQRSLNVSKVQISVPPRKTLKGSIKKNRVGKKDLYLYIDLKNFIESGKWSRPHFRLSNFPNDLKSSFSGKFILRAYNDSQGAAKDVLSTNMSCRAI